MVAAANRPDVKLALPKHKKPTLIPTNLARVQRLATRTPETLNHIIHICIYIYIIYIHIVFSIHRLLIYLFVYLHIVLATTTQQVMKPELLYGPRDVRPEACSASLVLRATNTILGVPYHKYSIIYPQTLL